MTEQAERIREVLEGAGLAPTEQQTGQLLSYYQKLIEVNQVMNLTAVTNFEEVLTKHFVDSAMLLTAADLSGKKMIDVGTGAGFPGLVLKILQPDLQITLLDSLRKRLTFLQDVCHETGLASVRLVHGRAEDEAHRRGLRESFDIAAARAVAKLPVLCEYCLPFVRTGGLFAAYKTGDEEELRSAEKAVSLLGGDIEEVRQYTLPGTDARRSLVLIRKTAPTPAQYPRKAGTPVKNPL